MEFREQQAIYLQIADHVCENILLQKWLPNDRLPSVRELAVDLQVNPNTVMRTYDFLQSQGVIFNKRGIGYFVSEDAQDKILAYRKEQFLRNDLPVFFRNIYLLGIGMEEIGERYAAFQKENFERKRLSKG
ncbi:MAG: GntR family transcriptional regulator [Cytophagales bacterium]|jgi:DNA-binding transcriptional regulator YhcF (GntR family)|nr:GntR family transcriptional regulator [Cytophagales bacterium]